MDHYGLARYIRPKVPVHIGESAHNIMKAASHYVPNGVAFTDPNFIADRRPIEIGPFRVTPCLVDHSAFDAYHLLVEADGKRVFYSGDFRANSTAFPGVPSTPPVTLPSPTWHDLPARWGQAHWSRSIPSRRVGSGSILMTSSRGKTANDG